MGEGSLLIAQNKKIRDCAPMRWTWCWIIGVLLVLGLGAEDSPDSRLQAMNQARLAASKRVAVVSLQQAPVAVTAGPIAFGSIEAVTPVNFTSVPRFAKVEYRILFSALTGTKYYVPDPAMDGVDLRAVFTGPSGSATIAGFYDGSVWRIRFAPTEIGAWTCVVYASDASGSIHAPAPAFTVVSSNNPGFIQIDGARLTMSGSGKTFFGIGHNIGWQENVEQPSFADMQAHGENLLSFWLAEPWKESGERTPIQNAAGGVEIFQQSACQYLDGVFERAEVTGVYLFPSIWAHDQLRSATGGHPWHPGSWENSGYSLLCPSYDFCRTTWDGTLETPQWIAQKYFYRYLMARWGYSTALMGWVGIVEVEGIDAWLYDQNGVRNWCTAVRSWFAANDPYRIRNGTVPFSCSSMNNVSFGKTAPQFDMRIFDSYGAQSDSVGIAQRIAGETRAMTQAGSPGFHSEFGGNISSGAIEPLHFHNAIWAGIAAGASMVPLKWCDVGGFPKIGDGTPVGTELQNHLQWLSQFVAQTDRMGDPTLQPLSATLPSTLFGCGRGHDVFAMHWFQAKSGFVGDVSVEIAVPESGTWELRWFDTWGDCRQPCAVSSAVATTANIAVTIPTVFRSDIALILIKTAPLGRRIRIAVTSAESGNPRLDGTLAPAFWEGSLAVFPVVDPAQQHHITWWIPPAIQHSN